MIETRIEKDEVELYDASSGMYRRTIRPGATPTSVEVEGDEIAITLDNGRVDIYSVQGQYRRTMIGGQDVPGAPAG
jgi:hypothetical protein